MASPDLGELLIGIGVEQDAASFRRAEASIFGLRNNALTAAAGVAAIGTAGFTAAKGVSALADVRAELGFNADAADLAVGAVDRLGFALSQLGGDAGNAQGVLTTMRDLRDTYRTLGEGALVDVGKFGIDGSAIAAQASEMESLQELSRQLQSVNQSQRNLALDALGFNGTGIRNVLRGGPEAFGALLERADELREVDEELIDVSQDLTQSLGELDRALNAMADTLVEDLAPGMTRIVDFLTEHLPDGGESAGDKFIRETPWLPNWLTRDVGEFLPSLGPGDDAPRPQSSTGNTDMDALLEAVGAVESGNRHRDAQGRLITSPAGARGQWQIMPDTGRDPGFGVMPLQSDLVAEHERFAEDYLSALLREFGDMDQALAAYNAGPGRIKSLVTQYGPDDFLQHAPRETRDYVERVGDRLGDNPQASVTQNINFTINGATDPEAVGRVVDQRVREFASRGADSYRGRVT